MKLSSRNVLREDRYILDVYVHCKKKNNNFFGLLYESYHRYLRFLSFL